MRSSLASLDTPVLFLIFNRPDTTAQVFEAIRKARPSRLYVAADGPREDREDEANKVAAARECVLTGIDWPCELKTLFREGNLGCKSAVSSAITWFFQQEDEGIILEDDCLPRPEFFRFCSELLEKYRDDSRVMHIGGFNVAQDFMPVETSYFFSRYPDVQGWATWRRAWKKIDVALTTLDRFVAAEYADMGYSMRLEKRQREQVFMRTRRGEIDSWGYCWDYAIRIHGGLCIYPNCNQVTNLGFSHEATHTKGADRRYTECVTGELAFPLVHPDFVVPSTLYDRNLFVRYVSGKTALARLLLFVYRVLYFDPFMKPAVTRARPVPEVESRRG